MSHGARAVRYSLSEYILDGMVNILGFGLSVAGLVLMIVFAATEANALTVTSFAVYGATLVTLFLTSGLYNAIPAIPGRRLKSILRIIDHSAIYLLIAGTYTPFMLVGIGGAWGWSLFGVVWGLAVVGIVKKLVFPNRFYRLSIGLYLALGWLCLIAIKPMIDSLPVPALVLALVGGVFYSLGVVFVLLQHVKYHVVFWHLFVLAGAMSHLVAVLFWIRPMMG